MCPRGQHVHSTPNTQHRSVGGTTHDTPGPVQVRGPDDGDRARTEPGANPAILGPVCTTTQQGVINSLTSIPYARARRSLNEARALHYRVVTRRGLKSPRTSHCWRLVIAQHCHPHASLRLHSAYIPCPLGLPTPLLLLPQGLHARSQAAGDDVHAGLHGPVPVPQHQLPRPAPRVQRPSVADGLHKSTGFGQGRRHLLLVTTHGSAWTWRGTKMRSEHLPPSASRRRTLAQTERGDAGWWTWAHLHGQKGEGAHENRVCPS